MNNKFLLALMVVLISSTTIVFSQNNADIKQEGVYTTAEVMPEFPGGAIALYDYFKANIKYPESAREKGTEGVVVTTFVVDAEGNVKNTSVLKGRDSQLDDEALRIINAMPKWKPGMQGGKNVSVQLVQPVRFSLTVPDEKNKKKK